MYRLKLVRHERTPIAVAVVVAHLAVAWLFWIAGQALPPSETPDLKPELIYIQKVTVLPRPVAPAIPDPVEFRLVPQTSPQPAMPDPSVIPVDLLDAPQPGPDPAPSTATEVTSPGPLNAGEKGFPGIGETRGLKVLRRVVPKYPVEAGRRGEEGTTFLLVHVDAAGRPGEMRLAKTSGFKRLDDAAALAARKWLFEPFVKDGKATDSWTLLELRFSLSRYSYSRILDNAAGSQEEQVRSGDADVGMPGGELALRHLFERMATSPLADAPAELAQKESEPLRIAFVQWGNVRSIRFMQRAAEKGTSVHRIRPEYRAGSGRSEVAVQWGMYEVRQEHATTVWRIAMDSTGEIWSVHAGIAPWSK